MRILGNFLGEYHTTFERILSFYQFSGELFSVVKKISLNF